METIIKVNKVSKKFCRRLSQVMVYGVNDIGLNMIGFKARSDKLRKGEFWALRDNTFEVKKGETLGVIGPNGSGKSTLLKLLNGIFMPDTGEIEICGKTGALIEVGAGFHPMLSGRENIYVNGAILGMRKSEIDEKFKDIIDFADIGEFIDAPVKHFSSGMLVRLGFSIAVHADPDILIVDEVLAVGDINFQIKCFRKIADFKKKGKTIIIVTHDMTAIQRHAERVLLLNKGEIICDDTPQRIVSKYLSLVTNDKTGGELGSEVDFGNEKGNKQDTNLQQVFYQESIEEDLCPTREGYDPSEFRYGNGAVHINDYKVLGSDGSNTNKIKSGDLIRFQVKADFLRDVEKPIYGVRITSNKELEIYNDNTLHYPELEVSPLKRGDTIWVEYSIAMDLAPGEYHLSAGIATINSGEVIPLDRRYDFIRFEILENDAKQKNIKMKSDIKFPGEVSDAN